MNPTTTDDSALERLLRAAVALFLLVSLVTGLALSGAHRHDLVGAEQQECAACVVGHAAAVAPASPPVPGRPLARMVAAPMGPRAVRTTLAFPHAAPLACGPPA